MVGAQREKLESAARGSETTPIGKRNKRSSCWTRIWYTLSLVNVDRFCQNSSITDADEIYDMTAVRDLSTSDVVFRSVINNTLKEECNRKEQKPCVKIWSMEDVFAILSTGFRKSLICQFFRVVSTLCLIFSHAVFSRCAPTNLT